MLEGFRAIVFSGEAPVTEIERVRNLARQALPERQDRIRSSVDPF